MTNLLVWLISVLVILLIVSFVFSVISLRSIPTSERPATATYNRYGEFTAMTENPDYHENAGEQADDEPDASDAPADNVPVGARTQKGDL